MKILVAIDGSPQSLAALRTLLGDLAWFRENPELTIFYSHPPLPYQRAVAWAGKDAVHAYYEEESEAALADARKLLSSQKIDHKVEKRVGEPAEEIIDAAAIGHHDLIVMGTHGRSAIGNLVLGSVATKVLAAGKTPVLFLH